MTEAEIRKELPIAERVYRRAMKEAEVLRTHRNETVKAAIAAGLTHAEIAKATGLTRGRVGQIASQ